MLLVYFRGAAFTLNYEDLTHFTSLISHSTLIPSPTPHPLPHTSSTSSSSSFSPPDYPQPASQLTHLDLLPWHLHRRCRRRLRRPRNQRPNHPLLRGHRQPGTTPLTLHPSPLPPSPSPSFLHSYHSIPSLKHSNPPRLN